MANRIYDRQTIQWTADDLVAMVDSGQATYFPMSFTYVVKLPEGGSVAVRPEQILPADEDDSYYDDGAYDAEMAYERYLEDGGPHALAIQAEDEEEQRREAMDVGLQMMRAQRASLDAMDAILAEGTPTADGGLLLERLSEEDALLAHFSN